MEIRVENLSKYYGSGQARSRALDDVSFTVEPGEFVAIMGTSGSGKTTLLNILGGLDSEFEGEVWLGEDALSKKSEADLARVRNARFGFVFQQFHLLEHLSAAENVALPNFFARDSGVSNEEAHRRAVELLGKVGLGDKTDSLPSELSGGQKQRVAIARALFSEPEVMFCDEPTGSLDRETGLEILELFGDLNRVEGVTIIMVTHEVHIAAHARRTLRVEYGELVSDAPNDATSEEE